MRDGSLNSWEGLPAGLKQASVEDLLEEWPTMSRKNREFVMSHNPDRVRAAGLWPGVDGDAEILKAIAEDPTDLSAKPPKPLGPPKPWHELPESIRTALVNSLRRDWPTLNPWSQRLEIAKRPEKVRAAGLWPGGRRVGPTLEGREADLPTMPPHSTWDEMPEAFRLAAIEDLRAEWPSLQPELQQSIMADDPEMVRAAGLWPAGLE